MFRNITIGLQYKVMSVYISLSVCVHYIPIRQLDMASEPPTPPPHHQPGLSLTFVFLRRPWLGGDTRASRAYLGILFTFYSIATQSYSCSLIPKTVKIMYMFVLFHTVS